jgi:uncharacterized membrane protein
MLGCIATHLPGVIAILMVLKFAFWGFRMHRYGHGGCHGGGWHGRRRGSFESEGFTRAASEVVKRRLGIDEEQEGIVDHALIDLRASVKEFVAELKATHEPLIKAFEGETVDDAAISTIFARHDDALSKARREIVSALKQIHAVLRPEQRERAVKWASKTDHRWV